MTSKRRTQAPRFLTVQEVVEIHRMAIRLHGGSHGVRDPGLLDSAVHAAQASYGEEFLYPDVFDMAAVYLIHIAANHAFIDGNKRTAWVACKTFLRLNGIVIKPRWKAIVELVEAVGEGSIRDWRKVSDWLADKAE